MRKLDTRTRKAVWTFTNGAYKYFLYRKLTNTGEQWLVQDERSAIRSLDREQFEVMLTDLLS
jgi:hypothetical protein